MKSSSDNINLTKYIADKLTNLSEEDIKSFTLFHPHRYSHFQVQMLKAYENLIIEKIKDES